MEIIIPNLGDIDEVEVIELCVEVGDHVEVEDALIVIESDKASMEIPSSAAGTVEAFRVAVGDMVAEGRVVAIVSGSSNENADVPNDPVPVAKQSSPEAVAEGPVEPDPIEAVGALQQIEVLVPDIGDAGEVIVIEIAVSTGDAVAVDDLLVVLESDKASMEITAEHAGTVTAVAVKMDQQVEQGSHIATLETTTNVVQGDASDDNVSAAPVPVLERTPTALKPTKAPTATVPEADSSQTGDAARVYAGPAVRRLARELGVDLTGVTGSGNRDRITKDDVKAFVNSRMQAPAAGGVGWPEVAQPDYAKFGEIELVGLSRIQQRGAENLHKSWVNLPHVTQHDEADVTELEAFRRSLKPEAQAKDIKLTPLAFIMKAVAVALVEFPNFNSSLHPDGKQLVLKKYINIGMAVDTPEGLVVPVIRDANNKNVWQLSQEIIELSNKARNKKLGLDDLQGGTFSVSSLGALGGTGFTPIVNAPEVAILGVSSLHTRAMWDGSEFKPRGMLPMSLSYDHRVVNGADGGRFMVFLTTLLGDIRRIALT